MVERLLALDAEAVALRAELARLSDVPRAAGLAPARRARIARHPWPLADDKQRHPDMLEPYDRRPDDAAILAAREGEAFLGALGEAPAPEMLRAAGLLLAERSAAAWSGEPDVSIVIPVHGQLAWTLNCLDALLSHASRWRAEIIVVDDASPDETSLVVGGLAGQTSRVRLVRLARNAGFVAACNAGAEAARGRHVVLLNNDTRVAARAGWTR